MAAGEPQPHPLNNEPDPDCRFGNFRSKPAGKVACLAIGDIEDADRGRFAQAPIRGIAFQSASVARIKPALPNDEFSTVEWVNAPTSGAPVLEYTDLDDPALAPAAVPPEWTDFAQTMMHAKANLLGRMTYPNAAQLDSLLEAFQARPEHPVNVNVIKNDVGDAWTRNRYIHKWAVAITLGCCGTPSHELCNALQVLFPDIDNITSKRQFQIPPSETSSYAPIQSGISHCLNYGYDEHQSAEKPKMFISKTKGTKGDHNVRNGERKSMKERQNMRVLLPKRDDRRRKNRSRSRSPVREADDVDEDNVVDHIINISRPQRKPNLGILDILDNQDEYLLKSKSYSKFLESHKPDLVGIKEVGEGQYVTKLVCEIASWCKYGRRSSLHMHVRYETEQCVQACLAALAHDQESILGLVVVVDGMKLIQVNRNRVNGHCRYAYRIEETDLVLWDDAGALCVLLEIIENALV